jgi:hypothetical protein
MAEQEVTKVDTRSLMMEQLPNALDFGKEP